MNLEKKRSNAKRKSSENESLRQDEMEHDVLISVSQLFNNLICVPCIFIS